jgi:glutamate-1-semialdehyde 2,1-aminomutase
LYDADGNRFVDYVGSWGPLILGHAAPEVVEAIKKAAADGTSFGAASAREVELAELVCASVPSVESVRFVSSGTEATMSALRLARGFTGRERFIKFSGCYHGHGDAFLSDAGSGLATLGIPASAGVPQGTAADTITLPYNDLTAVTAMLEGQAASDGQAVSGRDIAAIIVEPVACNAGLIPPTDGFLAGLRRLCDQYGIVLIFDEVITGFRLGLGGAQEQFDVRPDLTTFGKIIGGGLPVGAYGGRREIMDKIAPIGPVYQAGTLSGNPLAMAAGLATLHALQAPGVYTQLEERADTLVAGLEKALGKLAGDAGSMARVTRMGSIFHLWFREGARAAPKNYDEIKAGDAERYSAFFWGLLKRGVALAPSAFEVGFVSRAHSHEHIDATLNAMEATLEGIVAH